MIATFCVELPLALFIFVCYLLTRLVEKIAFGMNCISCEAQKISPKALKSVEAVEEILFDAIRPRNRLVHWQFPVLVITMSVLFGLPAEPAQSTVVDQQSGVPFPVMLVPLRDGTRHQLTGTATRERTIFRVKVYAYGLYVDAGIARSVLAAFVGNALTALETDPTFFERLLEMRIPMTLRLVMTRDVAGEAIGKSFDDALKPRIARGPESNRADASAALQRFRSYFNLNELAKGTEIVFSCSSDGRLNTMVNSESRPEIRSAELCRALFDVYLGNNAISSEGRRSLLRGFPALLRGA